MNRREGRDKKSKQNGKENEKAKRSGEGMGDRRESYRMNDHMMTNPCGVRMSVPRSLYGCESREGEVVAHGVDPDLRIDQHV